MKTFKQFQESCCRECDDSLYGIVEEDFEVTGDEEYEDWGEPEELVEGLRDPADNPCWKGYAPVGTKKKNGKTVPNCVPVNEENKPNVKLGKPFLTPGGPKKRAVYVKNDRGNVVKVNFGDPNLEIKRDNPARRRNFRARHNCESPGPRWKAKYWSCRAWGPKTIDKSF